MNKVDRNFSMFDLNGRRILVTGACGTIGAALIKVLLRDKNLSNVEIIGIDINESEIFLLSEEFLEDKRVQFLIGDVRDCDFVHTVMRDVQIVIHTAALKHVKICEVSPFEAVKTNLYGVQNIINAAIANDVEKVIFTSSDKAVNPTSLMGVSKLFGEGLIRSAGLSNRTGRTIFASTRFGNVLGSRGSVIPIFHQQIANGRNLKLTHRDMTRFIMSINEAVLLILDSAILARGGEIFVTKMPVIYIRVLAEVMIRELSPEYGFANGAIEIVEVGIKPGEKLYEELMTRAEAERAIELEKYFVILPEFDSKEENYIKSYPNLVSQQVSEEYTSVNSAVLDAEDLMRFLKKNNLFKR
jgi:FlaA1/EpsC-like NDP-sugar epimerase